jgi:hypothetical protein
MDEEVINDLYSRAKSKGYTKNRDEFVKLLHSDSDVLNDMYSYVKGKGYGKDINSFSNLVGKGQTASQSVTPVQKKKFASELSSEDGSLVSQKSPKPNMPVLTQEGFEQAMSKKKAVPTDMSGKALMKPASEIKKIKEKAAVLKGANKKSLETKSPLEGAYPQAPLSEPIAALVTGVPGVPKIPTLTETIGVPTKKIIEQEYKNLDLDNPSPYLSASTYNRQPVNGIAINKDNFIEEVFTDEKLINLGIDPADFDGYLNLSGYKEDYNKRKDRGDFEVGSVENPKLNEELYKSKLLSNYVRTKNDREVLKSKLQSVKASYEGKKIPVNKNAKALDNNLIAKYTEENLPVLYKKLKEKDQLNKEKYKELTQDNTGLNSFAIGAKNTLRSALNGFVDSVNKASATVYDALGADDLAEDLRYLNEERQLERPSERQVSFASGKVVDLAGKKYLVDEKGTVYDKDNEIVVNDLIEEGSLNKILEEAKKSKEEDWFFSPQGTAVQTGSVLGDMVWQVAYQASIGRVTKGLGKLSIPKGTADAIIAQSSLGYAQAYQTTLKEARDAGLTDKEAEQIAGDAAQRTAIWYGMTAPISPQTKAVESLFGSAEKELIKKAVGAYKTQGKQSFISTLNNGLKQISKKTVGIVEEGGKEAVQENIQQAGESLWINAQKNIEAGREISDDTMSFDDFVNTSILSFASGGLVSNLSMPSLPRNKKTQVRDLYQLSQNIDVLDTNLNEMVNNNIISKEDADNVKKDAVAVSRNITRIPKDTNPEVQLDVMRKLSEIEDLENSKNTLDKSFHSQIDEKIQEKRNEVKEIYDISLTKPTETNAVQEQSTTEVPVQSEAITSETLETGVSQPGPEVVTEQVTQEEVAEPTIKDSQIPLKRETFESETDNGTPFTIEVTTNKDGSRRIVTKVDGTVSGGEILSKDNTLSTIEYLNGSYGNGDIQGETKLEQGNDIMAPAMKEKLTPEQKAELGIEEVTPSKTITTEQEVKSGQKVFDVINRPAVLESFGGSKLENPIEGDIYQEGQRVIFEDKNNKIYDLGNIDEISDNTVEDLGIKPQEELMTLTPEGKVKIGDNTWNIQSELPTKGIDYNNDGSVKAVSLKDDAGKTIMYEGQIAEDIAYQTLLKEFQTEEQIQAINEILEKDEELNKQLREAEEVVTETAGEITEPSPTEVTTTEATSSDVEKIKSDIEASKERLKKAWDKYKIIGIAFDPKSNLARDKELVKSLVEYAYNNIRLGSYTASKLIEDLANQGFEMTRDGAKFIMDRASRKVQRDIDKTIGIKPKATEQKRINKAYSVGVATQKVATKEAKAEVKDLKGQVVDVFKAGIEAVKIAQSTAKEKARAIKTKSEELAKYLDELKGAGKITANQATAMVKRFSKVNVLSEKSVNRFIDYTTKVLNDADYNSKLTEARKTLSSLKKLSKDTEKNADLRVVASEFVKIDPSMVENIDEYNDIANKLKTAVEGSKIRKANTKIVDTVNIDDVNTYVEKILTEQETKLRDEKIAEIQSLFGVDAKDFSAEEIDALLESDEDIADDDAKIVRATLNKAFDVYSTVIDEMLNTGVDPFTGEDVEFTNSQKKIIKDFMGIDLDTVTDNKDALRIIDSLINFIQNKSTAGMLKPIADFQGITGGVEAEKQGFKAEKLRKYWIPKLGKALSKAFTTTPVLLEKMFKGVTRALEFEELIGLSDLINNSSKSESDTNMIVKEYVKKFYKREANGESYNSAYNDIERGVIAHMARNVIGTESRMKKVFDKRKQEVLDTIKLLSSKGNDSEQEIAKLIQKAYDKILNNSESIKDVKIKSDENNVQGVEYWVNQWDSRYEALSDLALNFYNKALGRDLGYTPDRLIKLQDKREDVDLEDTKSQFFANTDEILYDKKSGSLMDKQENRKIPKDMYVDFSFDKKNANAMNDALTDLYTAFDIRKVGAFLKSDSFRKIFTSSAEANLVDKRIKKFVRITRRKTPYSNDEISDFLKEADRLAKLGVTMSLASVKQPFVQTIPVMVSTAINAGGVGIGAAFDPKFNAWLNELGYAISNRGVESQAQLESMNKLLEKAADMPLDKAFKFVEKVQDESLKLLLVKGDVAVARASFKAYYEQSLKRQGLYKTTETTQTDSGERTVETKGIDYSKHKPNKEAANYAQRMVDRQQNISNQALAGDLFTSESSGTKIFIKMLMPFSSFRMNQASRLSSDLGTLEYWNTSTKEDKIIALRSIAGYAAESATYRGLQIGTAMLFSSLASLIMGDDDEEEDKKYKENLIKGAAQGMFIDTFSPLPLADPFTQDALAYSVDELQNLMDISEDEKIKLFGSKDQSMLKVFGTLGIPVEKAKDIIMLGKLAYSRKYTDKYGNKKEISQENADKLKTLIAPLIVFTLVGFASPDMSAVVRRSKKIAEKGSKKGSGTRRVMSQEEYDRLTK